MFMALVCREFGWTYQQYMEQPAHFIDIITEMFKGEGKAKK